MTKADLVERAIEQIGPGISKRDAAIVVDAFLEAVKEVLAEGQHIEIRGFGTFKVHNRQPRLARNPRTGAAVPIPSRKVAVFKVSKDLNALVAQGVGE
ncbi:MAG: integration host factor subunit beta [Gemmatimonadetes bacterium]|nr:integration host factor subunit beta [Gemmatimonadota bacterium]